MEYQVNELNDELTKYKMGPARLLSEEKDAFAKENETELVSIIDRITEFHPQSQERKQIDALYVEYKDILKKREEERIKEQEKIQKEKMASLNRLKKSHDDISGITWYENPYFTHYVNRNNVS